MSFRTRIIAIATVLIISRCQAFDLDFSWYHSIDSSNVVECRIRTAVFDAGDDRHITTRRCEALVDAEGDSHGIIYDIPQWIVQKHEREIAQKPRAFLRIEGARFARHNVTEGARAFKRSGNTNDQILVDVNAKIEISSVPFNDQGNHRRAAAMIGESNVLVVRVSTNDGAVALNASSISARVFGSYGTPASQFNACSMGKKQLLPATGSGITGGVLELTVNSNIRGISAGDFENLANTALATKVASLDAYDHIIYCLPPGSLGAFGEPDWIAYAYIEWNRAFFNDGACGYLSNYVHELGHNMGLGHSGKNGAVYGDQSGIMGFGYEREYWPLVCFNSAKNWQLGWYSDKAVELAERSSCGPWKGRLYGFPDYTSVPYNGLVLIKIGDVFIQYNKIAAMNRDTKEKANTVAFTRSTADLNSMSWALDGLNSGTFQYAGLCVDICGMFLDHGSEYFDVVVRNCSHVSICSDGYTPLCSAVPSASTPSPVRSGPTSNPAQVSSTVAPMPNSVYVPTSLLSTPNPTPMPTTMAPAPNPTRAPTTVVPTSNPTQVPTTRSPTPNPTKAPTASPSPNPTLVPTTRLPTLNPTKVPTIPPTPVPTTRPPTLNPTKVPTPFPTTGPPTPNPTKVPTIPPTPLPTTRLPTLNPTKTPTIPPTPLPTTRPPTLNPTKMPTRLPTTRLPTLSPTMVPTAQPTPVPITRPPTSHPTRLPTPLPSTRPPTMNPTKVPTIPYIPVPTARPPTVPPTRLQTPLPTRLPTLNPTKAPTLRPSPLPTARPPTVHPTKVPAQLPATRLPTLNPTKVPTFRPSPAPTLRSPTLNPTMALTRHPTPNPIRFLTTRSPTIIPTNVPGIPATGMICDDNLLGVFPYPGVDGFVRDRNCLWLLARPHMWEVVCRNNRAASRLCRETCGECVDNCTDTKNEFVFEGFQRNCLWLSVRLGVVNEVCHVRHKAYTVCPETCGACDAILGSR